MTIYSAQTSASLHTNSASPTPIPGLSITLPPGIPMENKWPLALVILNVPNPYATGNNYPGGWFGISVDGTTLPAFAAFTYESQTPSSSGRMPTTLVVPVPLAAKAQTVQALWQGIRGSTVLIDSPSSLSAIAD